MKKFEFVFPPKNLLNERFIATFGITLKQLLKKMFGGDKVPILVKGSKKQIKAFRVFRVHSKEVLKTFWNTSGTAK